jgi:O-antigen/teichoic acid export membrane protein
VVMAGISIMRRTKVLAVLAVLAAVLNIGLNFALIPPYGMLGAAVATVAAYAALTMAHYRVAQHYYRTPYEPGRVLTAIALATGFGILGVVPLGPTAVAVAVKILALGAYVLLLRVFRVVDRDEVARMRSLLGGLARLRAAQA